MEDKMKNVFTIILLLFCLSVSPAMAQNTTNQTDEVIGINFPDLSGESLSGQKVALPQAAAGKVTLIMIALKRDSIPKLDPWLKAYDEAFGKNKSFAFYKIPMMKSAFAKQISSMINGKMKKDNPEELHDKIITYYGPVEDYVKVLGIDDEEKGYAFILDIKGAVKWQSAVSDDQDSIKEMINAAKLLGN
jgi:hypothetical protein